MKWVLSHQSAEHHQWLLQDASEHAQFTYNLHRHAVRLKTKNHKVFFLEMTGVFNKKIEVRGEYGVIIGESQITTTIAEGMLTLYDEKYFFSWRNELLSLSDKNHKLIGEVNIEHANNLDKLEQFALIYSSAWITYTQQHAKKLMLVA